MIEMIPSHEQSNPTNVSEKMNAHTIEGLEEILDFLISERRRPGGTVPVIAIDGFPGNDWREIIQTAKKSLTANL
ncbi:hypothetical protein V511_05695 [Mesotoga sp. Brook.08.YT.4.2.5.1]|uniref:hypothetical protein n=1 Tax=Mesotoga sp. Brook.08.YT.4.2.5.1 TaxID=1421001 RepID=UPI000C9A0C79|nr:hypothetical protein [Mesotoga sp. Brook.08.YT.4.2.5.1]PNE22857.1 hypothetical protein V511_05695 [Mesotoga sp. Brook.08.YT.4.2.5.1]